ncbi:MAG: amino acid adenylation domain-containing protein, partial [bacterium]|nr:amino acid adenylation domain-containing protein [bacterium]
PDYPQDRIDFMLKDSNARLLLTKESDIFRPGSRTLHPAACNRGFQPATSLAYIIYTSGTTGKPKGTLTTHSNVVRVVRDTNYIELNRDDRVLQLSNYAFDGSVFDIYGALLNGTALVMIRREDVLSPERLAETIKRESISVFFVTTALFNALVDFKIECFAGIRKVLFGGERVSVEHSRKALDYLGKGRIIHVYGPTETTVYATYYFIDEVEKNTAAIPIGKPIANTGVYILDSELKPVPPGVTGEIYIGGSGVARGYLNRPLLTCEKFIPNPFLEGDMLYRTGDLGRWLSPRSAAGGASEGNIEFQGRIDHQVKLRGYRIELGEIENQLLNLPTVKEAVVLKMTDSAGDGYLCAYLVPAAGQDFDIPGLRENLGEELPGYMIPSYFVSLDNIPLTANGKVDRKRLPVPETGATVPYIVPRDEVEKKLTAIWSGVLGIPEEKIGIDDNFFDLGGHSLKGTVLLSKVHTGFNIKISLAQLFRSPQIRGMADFIRQSAPERYIPIQPVDEREFYPLSFNQKRLWFIHQREPGSFAFNMPGHLELEHAVDGEVFKKALYKMVERHESFRTLFKMVDDEPVQFILPRHRVELPVGIIDISFLTEPGKELKAGEIFSEVSRKTFDLETAPLLRVLLVKMGAERYRAIYNMHHIISDGWSLQVFEAELLRLYEGYRTGDTVDTVSLEPLVFRYRDFAHWDNQRMLNGEDAAESHRFWKERLEGGVPRLQLPHIMDGDAGDLSGAGYRCMIPKDLKERLEKLAREYNTTLFVVMFSFYLLVLGRYSNQQPVSCSIISAGRDHEVLHPIIGFFVNSILFHTRIGGGEVFGDFLARMHHDVMECFRHQHYPLEQVFEELRMKYPEIPETFNMVNILETGASDLLEPFE